MGLKIAKYANGEPRPTWWARFCTNGKYHDADLHVAIGGTIPRDENGNIKLTAKGDADFERSRLVAQRELDRLLKAKHEAPEEMRAKVYKARTGVDIEGVPLSKLAELWKQQKRGYTPTTDWGNAVCGWFDDFARFAGAYAAKHNARCETVNDITPEIVCAWFDELKGKFAWETVTKKMSLMRSAFRRYATSGRTNPFEDVVMRNRETGNARVNHKPLTANELARLFDLSRDDRLYPLIVTAACTGMRIGDVCNLHRADVDLPNGLIDVVTAKAGVRATIPIFGRLCDVLNKYCAEPGDGKKPNDLIFPWAATTYKHNPDAIYKGVKPYFAKAVFGDADDAVIVQSDGKACDIETAIANTRFTDAKRARVIEVYKRFKAGEQLKDIAASMGMARSQASMYLHDAECVTGEQLCPRAKASRNRQALRELLQRTRGTREIGARAASLYGWHSLRATFVVLAVEAGVPLADVQRVVGHSTVDMTMQYFNPERKHAAERVRVQMAGGVLDPQSTHAIAQGKTMIDEIIAGLSKTQKQQLIARIAAGI